MNANNLIANIIKTVKSNSPEILTALGVTGVVSTAYLSAKGSFQAAEIIAEEENGETHPDKRERFRERTKLVWKCYIPATISGALTIICVVGSNKASGARTAAAVTAYSLAEKQFSEYRDKVREQIGKGKEQGIRDDIAQEQVTANNSKEIVIHNITGTVLCCELYTKRYFRSDMESLRKAQNDLNAILISQIFAALDEFYDILGLEYTQESTFLGWDSDKLMELEFSTTMSPSGEPCLAFAYNYVKPVRGM